MLEGVMLLWFVLTGLSVAFVAIDIRSTPESPVLKWGFVLLTAYTGPLGAFLYVLGCREPLPGLHERYTAVRWRQVLGSTMHCVAGDGVGILVGAVIASTMQLTGVLDVTLEYVLGFGFGWTIFQALFMRGEAGGSYKAALRNTFFPELLSMNVLMAGMVATRILAAKHVTGAHDPAGPAFWFVMSMALLVGFVVAYPMNWWLVSRHLKHGMMTVGRTERSAIDTAAEGRQASHAATRPPQGAAPVHTPHAGAGKVSRQALAGMTFLSFLVLALGLGVAASG
ncbi:MAG: DUF4396 domain-containing protein [Rhodanobacter sp.]|nr:MAG: DUF4396 domain-containing protein [Rhodanobacter sp.]TAM04582.1 MAG: DUF4396 domain-containing protein [Rhodanobacter sp.]TAM42165.1 MAG: DUF4396 domain-containing protein [Rhodanobacter sp.]TAN26766.1 MAG: DUF4396 domain-containing protein [Rhodanobacter sp.]